MLRSVYRAWAAIARYKRPLYRAKRCLFGTGYNLNVLGGL